MSIEKLDALVIEVLDRMRNAASQLDLDKAKALGEMAKYLIDRTDYIGLIP